MAANFLHGVETIVINDGPRVIREVKSAVIGLIGTAPLYKVAPADQTINTPQLILGDDRQAIQFFGDRATGFTIPQALDALLDHGAGVVVVVNVFDPAVHKTTAQAIAYTLPTTGAMQDKVQLRKVTGTAPSQTIVAGTTAEGLTGTFTVTNAAGTTTYVATTDYTIDVVTGLLTRVVDGAITSGQELRVTYTYADPSLIDADDIVGTVTVGGQRTGLKAMQDVYSLLGFTPKILICPGFSEVPAVQAEMLVQAENVRAMALIDAPVGATYTQAIAGRAGTAPVNVFGTSSRRAILLFNRPKARDSITNSDVLEPYSQRFAGVMAKTDRDFGYWWSPSNKEILGITGVETKLTAAVNDPDTQTNLLNENGIVTIFNAFGTGLRTWGNRSAAWPSDTSALNFINIQRTTDILHESIEYSMLQFLDQPISAAVLDAIVESVNGFIRQLILRGALVPGSRCFYEPARNPALQLANGQAVFNLDIMPPPPLERITFESRVNINLLQNVNAALQPLGL
ncbi:phage tail sheath subtilisin-like domain-containing protein [Thermoleptolyngbya sp. M55_K2018_002]|uniref:phage tail sheath family protein n=1 Tax=Thermoleptolyngbya sp. M55_K2018_002 TaxID=2747808 RepID=UPI0019F47214|nr:phage tail sheath subtilisin-like domain-containing protein [Thermoleptolyngbya sp. M55_K2018_002]HIK42157.1 phage tail sheath subtilisin-like domain-containing protein [Thermoleptolyngbya sp. M55_K2018_002]